MSDPTPPAAVRAPPPRPGREILGISAVVLPFTADGAIDWNGFASLVARTVDCGLVPAVNMDTGYVQLIDDEARTRAIAIAADHAGPHGFAAGAFVDDREGAAFQPDRYFDAMEEIVRAGGTPVVFPSYGLNARDGDSWVDAHATLARHVDRMIAFELGPMFVPYGRIYDLDAFEALLQIPQCVGAKHSSLSRPAEWDRLAIRDRLRPDFHVFTGNDLAIDMVCYGSDYLLGLSAFAPDAFAERDRRWQRCDRRFHELNDLLQYLGAFAFRAPVPAYRHDAAMFLALRGRIGSDAPPSGAPQRPDSDRAVLTDIAQRLDSLL
jgi:dihydrodipicolinate synthase/N-acetylneuraminate lyase